MKKAIVMVLMVLGCALLSITSVSVRAQAPTPTPYPAIVMTATASAERVTKAQQSQQQAAQLQAQADAARRQADAEFQAAQQEANNARSALLAQQMQAAGEALGRAEANISNGRAQLDQQTGMIGQLRAIVDEQAATITQDTEELQICRVSKQLAVDAYAGANQQLQDIKGKLTIDPIIVVFFFVVMLAIVLGFVVMKWQSVTIIPARPSVPDEEGEIIDSAPTTIVETSEDEDSHVDTE